MPELNSLACCVSSCNLILCTSHIPDDCSCLENFREHPTPARTRNESHRDDAHADKYSEIDASHTNIEGLAGNDLEQIKILLCDALR